MTLSIQEARRSHRASIVSLTLTEILILMVFSVMTYNLMSKEKGEKPSSELEKLLDLTKQELAQTKHDLARAITEKNAQYKKVEQIKKVLQSKERLLKRLLGEQDGTLPVAQKEIYPKLQQQIRELEGQLSNERGIIVDQQMKIKALHQRLIAEGKDRTGYPVCPVTTGYLFKIKLNPDATLSVLPAWSGGAEADAMELPGVPALVKKPFLPIGEFSKYAARLYRWGDEQTIPCRFTVSTIRKSRDLDTYIAQIRAIERYFYAKKDY